MVAKFLVVLAVSLVSISCAAQVAPEANSHRQIVTSVGGGLDYWSGDWGAGKINRWGPSAWATAKLWHGFSVIAQGNSMIVGGYQIASNYKYFEGGGGLEYTSDHWGRLQPLFHGEAGFGSLTQPGNDTGHFHDTRTTWKAGGGLEYYTWRNMWTRVEYDYDFFPDFHSSITDLNHTLNPRGMTFGETFRFGRSGSRY